MRDHIFIEGLAVDCLIGLADWERMVKQTVVLDLRLGVDIAGVAARDQVEAGDFNTKALSKRLQEFVGGSEFRLIETLAEQVVALVLAEFPVGWVQLRLSKPGALRGASNVGVMITREKEPS
jgi:dihydroneopterin aldolase